MNEINASLLNTLAVAKSTLTDLEKQYQDGLFPGTGATWVREPSDSKFRAIKVQRIVVQELVAGLQSAIDALSK